MKMYVATIEKEPDGSRLRDLYYSRQKKLFIMVVALVLIIPLAAISLYSYNYYKDSWIDKTSVELASLAESRKEIIELFLVDQQDSLAGIVELYSLEYLRDQNNLAAVFAAFNRSAVITDLSVVDAEGNHVAYVGPFEDQLAGRNYADADWFVSVMADGRHVSDIFSGFRDVPHFVVAVKDPTGAGALRATVNSDLFNSLLTEAEVGPDGDAFIISRSGEFQTPSRLGAGAPPFEFGSLPAEGVTVRHDGAFIYAATALKDGDWMLVMETDIDSSLSGFYSARNSVIIFILLSVTVIVTAATLIISSMINRLREADRQRLGLNNRMREVEKMALVGRLAASVAHEINNPLQIIEGQAGWISDLLEDEQPEQTRHLDEYVDASEKIRAHVRRARDITHRLLGFSRSGGERLASTDINRLVDESVSFLADEAKNNRIAIEQRLDDSLPEVVTDSAQLQQVFLNIINNAIDAIGQDGVISITTRPANGSGVATEFSDTGPGLAEDVLAHIFDPFFTTKDGRNAGLGLSISYNILQRLGGDIAARNGEDGGSIFTVTLPVELPERQVKHRKRGE